MQNIYCPIQASLDLRIYKIFCAFDVYLIWVVDSTDSYTRLDIQKFVIAITRDGIVVDDE